MGKQKKDFDAAKTLEIRTLLGRLQFITPVKNFEEAHTKIKDLLSGGADPGTMDRNDFGKNYSGNLQAAAQNLAGQKLHAIQVEKSPDPEVKAKAGEQEERVQWLEKILLRLEAAVPAANKIREQYKAGRPSDETSPNMPGGGPAAGRKAGPTRPSRVKGHQDRRDDDIDERGGGRRGR